MLNLHLALRSVRFPLSLLFEYSLRYIRFTLCSESSMVVPLPVATYETFSRNTTGRLILVNWQHITLPPLDCRGRGHSRAH